MNSQYYLNILALKVFTDLELLEYLPIIYPCEYHQIKQNVRYQTLASGTWLNWLQTS